MHRHLFLVGFMGSGKTHWGKIVASSLGCLFLDLDEWIEANEGRSIASIFAAEGETGFRQLERTHLIRLAALPPTVVATGGGTPCFFDNMEWMKQHGATIYIKTPPLLLLKRLKNKMGKRPMLKGLSEAQLADFIHNLLDVREPYYRQADVVLEQIGEEDMFLQAIMMAIGVLQK